MAEDVTVSDAIKQLRAQLEDAQRDGVGKELRFLAKGVELELAIVFKSGKEGGGGVKAWFLDVSGKASAENETTHRIKLTLEPVDSHGKPKLVGDTEHETQ